MGREARWPASPRTCSGRRRRTARKRREGVGRGERRSTGRHPRPRRGRGPRAGARGEGMRARRRRRDDSGARSTRKAPPRRARWWRAWRPRARECRDVRSRCRRIDTMTWRIPRFTPSDPPQRDARERPRVDHGPHERRRPPGSDLPEATHLEWPHQPQLPRASHRRGRVRVRRCPRDEIGDGENHRRRHGGRPVPLPRHRGRRQGGALRVRGRVRGPQAPRVPA